MLCNVEDALITSHLTWLSNKNTITRTRHVLLNNAPWKVKNFQLTVYTGIKSYGPWAVSM